MTAHLQEPGLELDVISLKTSPLAPRSLARCSSSCLNGWYGMATWSTSYKKVGSLYRKCRWFPRGLPLLKVYELAFLTLASRDTFSSPFNWTTT